MSTPLEPSQIEQIQAYDAEQRYKYLVKEVVSNREIWILTDEHGCVMLNTDDEDCVPVWPNKEFAESWATGEWENCKAEAISLNKWHSRWTYGLEDDELAIVIFPNQDEDGLVVFPDELDFELKQQAKKSGNR
ncbi:DUF2750 domain-containing protein [Photobacterium gaetbulicola]|uniref:Phage-shock protein n=2 Tax=Photobacterium gaetbulicola TaxID=1295392 RepID=A0A0C5WR21_9GAMM|nr:DUF2750 domain-containing protein [Photobacterium gaetbulicola]AJR05410.1 hypothetical protein H744_1c0385 [Photobacterium gaetbulicola Gung47]KHT62335.1 phage-shock protein [Photobacterium gaetbulicola]PSU12734.1 DUF2750 domain-containing protein [Photobacterium gaetbulicola]